LPNGFNGSSLHLSSSPMPGQDVWICGFPCMPRLHVSRVRS
jgi:hypothetical protein